MQTPAPVDQNSDPDQAIQDIRKIDVGSFDNERTRMRRKMVSQRFILGLVEMFETFPDLPYVLFVPGETSVLLVQPPPPDDVSMVGVDRPVLAKKIQKSLQSARAAITPQSRETLDALNYFFGNLRTSMDGPARLQRQVFTREFLPWLADQSTERLTPDLVAFLVSQTLVKEVASHSIPAPSPFKSKM